MLHALGGGVEARAELLVILDELLLQPHLEIALGQTLHGGGIFGEEEVAVLYVPFRAGGFLLQLAGGGGVLLGGARLGEADLLELVAEYGDGVPHLADLVAAVQDRRLIQCLAAREPGRIIGERDDRPHDMAMRDQACAGEKAKNSDRGREARDVGAIAEQNGVLLRRCGERICQIGLARLGGAIGDEARIEAIHGGRSAGAVAALERRKKRVDLTPEGVGRLGRRPFGERRQLGGQQRRFGPEGATLLILLAQ